MARRGRAVSLVERAETGGQAAGHDQNEAGGSQQAEEKRPPLPPGEGSVTCTMLPVLGNRGLLSWQQHQQGKVLLILVG